MIQEEYCSFEIAKLLKEKGFDEECHYAYHYWTTRAFFHRKKKNFNGSEYQGLKYEWFSCPTLHTVMRWLEKKGIFLEMFCYARNKDDVEAELKYALENLI